MLTKTSSEKDIVQRISDLNLYTKMGKEITFPSDDYLLIPINRNVDSIESARIDLFVFKLIWCSYWSGDASDLNLPITNPVYRRSNTF